MQRVLQLDPRDNVLIALTDLKQGDQVDFNGSNDYLVSNVQAKHKFATTDLPLGADVIMYGVLVVKTYQPVKKGEVLTLANLRHESAEYQEKSAGYSWIPPDVSRWRQKKFLGYRRSDGQVGTRNYWIVVPLVFCENRNIVNLKQAFEEELGLLNKAISATFEGLVEADTLHREPADLSHLSVGLKCGGSDGFSGLSANPAIGHTSDLLVALGARTILSEFPELCGVEQDLINRSISKDVGHRFIQLMRDYENRARAVRSSFAMNPAPGNIRDGLLTDAMKSAGAAKKGGTSPVTAALDYPEYSTEPGLNLLCTPGNDVECVTGQVGAGASVVLFTTGLGKTVGNRNAPVIKLSTNTSLAQRMPDIIDIDTGAIITGESTIEQMGELVLDQGIRVARRELHAKVQEKGQEDFIPWKRGISL